ncbi:MAG: hypothetical protein HUK09_04755, partial [Bacteroidaceae bacterium]|nr:hypothetical protein [Bacteroidaceae bacterium]
TASLALPAGVNYQIWDGSSPNFWTSMQQLGYGPTASVAGTLQVPARTAVILYAQ